MQIVVENAIFMQAFNKRWNCFTSLNSRQLLNADEYSLFHFFSISIMQFQILLRFFLIQLNERR